MIKKAPNVEDRNPLTAAARLDLTGHIASCPACVTDDDLDLCLVGSDLFHALESQVALDRAFDAVDAFLATRSRGHGLTA